MAKEVFAELAPDDLRAILFQPPDAPGVEGLDAVQHLILIQHGAGGGGQGIVVPPLRLQLHHQGKATLLKQGQHLLQKGNFLVGALQAVGFQLPGRQVLHQHINPSGTQKACIVDNGQISVLHQMHIQLHAEAPADGLLVGKDRVFRGQILSVVAPVGIAILPQQLPVGMAPAAHSQQGEYLCQEQQNNNN